MSFVHPKKPRTMTMTDDGAVWTCRSRRQRRQRRYPLSLLLLLLLSMIMMVTTMYSVAANSVHDTDNNNDKTDKQDTCDNGTDAVDVCEQQQDYSSTTTTTTTTKTKRSDYNWNATSTQDHPCNIRRISRQQVLSDFGPNGIPPLYPEPLIIVNNSHVNEGFRARCQRHELRNHFPVDFNITLSSSNSFSAFRRTMTLREYIDKEIMLQDQETFPDQLSNETWYFFGESHSLPWREFLQPSLYGENKDDAASLLDYQLPPCVTCTNELVALSFGIGNRGSGVSFHEHGGAFSESVIGAKHWLLYPPGPEVPIGHDPDYSSRYWMEYVYPSLTPKTTTTTANDGEATATTLHECTVQEGEIIYIPKDWWHAIVNLDPYTVFVSSFLTEHGLDLL